MRESALKVFSQEEKVSVLSPHIYCLSRVVSLYLVGRVAGTEDTTFFYKAFRHSNIYLLKIEIGLKLLTVISGHMVSLCLAL
jgi:hypothetical protein